MHTRVTTLWLALVAVPMAAQQRPGDLACTTDSTSGDGAFDLKDVRKLAGEYDLVMTVDSGREWGSTEHRGRLVLWVQDSAHAYRGPFSRAVPGHERWIAGTFTAAPPDTDQWWRRMASPNRDHPGVIWQYQWLRFGEYDAFDGTGEDLYVTHMGPAGFRGTWREDTGIAMLIDSAGHRVPNAAGHFCAFRISGRIHLEPS